MRVTIRNLGPIGYAELHDAPLVLLLGENGSGKSTIAEVYYAIARSLPEAISIRGSTTTRRRVRGSELLRLRSNFYHGREIDAKEIPGRIPEILKAITDQFLSDLQLEVPRVFGAGWSELIRKGGTGANRGCRIEIERPDYWRVLLGTRYGKPTSSFELIKSEGEIGREITAAADRIARDEFGVAVSAANFPASLMFEALVSAASRTIIGDDTTSTAHLLPAARAGILQAHRLVASSIMQSAAYVGLQERNYPGLTGVTADFISELLLQGGGPRRGRNKSFEAAIEHLESRILLGRVHTKTESGQYPEMLYTKPTVGDLPMHRASSMVNELAPLILLLREGMLPGDLLILEEPESHLHPRLQRLLAEALILIVRAGGRVMATTHSDFFLNELNLATQRSLSRRRGSISLESESWVSYRLVMRSSGSVLEPIERDDLGLFSDSEFSDVAVAQYEERIELDSNPGNPS